eukprot:215222_1
MEVKEEEQKYATQEIIEINVDAGDTNTTSEAQNDRTQNTASNLNQHIELSEPKQHSKSVCINDMNCNEIMNVLHNYAFNALNDESINNERKQIEQYFEENNINGKKLTEMKPRKFRNHLNNHCNNNDKQINEPLDKLYKCIQQYPQYKQLIDNITNRQIKTQGCCSCNSNPTNIKLNIINRQIISNKLILYKSNHENETQLSVMNNGLAAIEISSSTYNITSKSQDLEKGDMISNIEFGGNVYDLKGIEAEQIYKLLMYQPTPYTLTFERYRKKCGGCGKSSKKTKKKAGKCGQCVEFVKHPTEKILKWLIKFMKLSLRITSKASSTLDAVTDIILLYKSSQSVSIVFTMTLFITLLAPYILSYSSGIQVFLYRKTFQNVELFTFKSLLLGLYLFPTGIIYFILLDIIDIFSELYKWIGYGCIEKIKSQNELVQIESKVAEYFGMSRMDWLSFRKQKLIAQLFFETIPQVILQVLLFLSIIKGKELSGVTDSDLILSICSAGVNFIIQIFRLIFESRAVQETFIEYSLNCITARYEWVPFKHNIEQFNVEPINYNIQYELPLITALTKYMKTKNDLEPLQIEYKHKRSDITFGCVEYDFSKVTVNALISTIKNLSNYDQKIMTINFGKSLRLLDIRSIISLMQACKEKNIKLPDIHEIDWKQAFENTTADKDVR